MMENHFTELGEATILVSILLVPFKGSLYRFSIESLFSKKLFERASRFSRGSVL
jgi:hypothetical protein